MIKAFKWMVLIGFLAVSSLYAKSATVGYIVVNNPWKYAISQKWLEKETGYDIKWKKFTSGAAVINAMASGDVDVAMCGSSPIVAGLSKGLDFKLFWITADIAEAEALVVRNGSGIVSPQDLKGKRIGVPFASTTHFHILFALEQFGISPKELKVLNLQGPEIATAWKTKRIDGAFVWDPVLGEIKKTGKVLITSDVLNSWGKTIFDGMVVQNKFARNNNKFMEQFVKVISKADSLYRNNPKSWTPKSKYVKAIVKLIGGSPELVPVNLALYNFLTLAEQNSSKWLGGGSKGGIAKALLHTAEFLKDQKKIEKVYKDYGQFVTTKYIKANL